ncbi:nucleoside phosphorylase domain-containing protein [Mariannaea sp. PMI_226]|nr:nucleoside phosphorylase domain-containing protein [Mariannaea sp. PMI_226]
MGTNSAVAATASLRLSYTSLRLALLVGICGGVPHITNMDAFLGDVVISKTIIQYNYSRQYPRHFIIKNTVEDSLRRDIWVLLTVFKMELMREWLQNEALEHLQHMQAADRKKWQRANYQYPGMINNKLYPLNYVHKHQTPSDLGIGNLGAFYESASKAYCSNTQCGSTDLVARERFIEDDRFSPEIFIGRIGSGNTIMKSREDRDRIAAASNIIGFKMEGARAWDEVPYIVIKGICNYANSHKNKAWQDFAAATAVSVMKAILGRYVTHGRDQSLAQTNGPEQEMSKWNVSSNSFGNLAWINQGDVRRNLTF